MSCRLAGTSPSYRSFVGADHATTQFSSSVWSHTPSSFVDPSPWETTTFPNPSNNLLYSHHRSASVVTDSQAQGHPFRYVVRGTTSRSNPQSNSTSREQSTMDSPASPATPWSEYSAGNSYMAPPPSSGGSQSNGPIIERPKSRMGALFPHAINNHIHNLGPNNQPLYQTSERPWSQGDSAGEGGPGELLLSWRLTSR